MKTGTSLHAKRKRVIVELVKGKEIATRLQTLLRIPGQDHGSSSVSPGDLAFQIFRSFNKTLSVLSSSCAATSPQIAAVDCGGSACSGESKQKPEVKSRRGCYKRRRSCESWTKICSSMVEDGYAWRKYGQKDILDSQYPRCYFRCTHKYEGCKATKQVQRIKEEPILYQTTYFNHHTCTVTPRALPLIPDSNLVDPNLLNFQTGNTSEQEECQSMDPEIKKEECSKENDLWQEMIGLDSFGYKPIWDPTMSSHQEDGGFRLYSCEATSLSELHMRITSLAI
ncbi:UNVERIFIED_CONTAM: WRKY DNA-binding transcription factor 70 [Sesamum angustifolium]|uniref:WRKY DNA-binding transcription factor 70 n=1 Tax=Sesamum angustifolium TaxID=2727405 RepID=A0AAW2PUH8_9LAMI